MKTIITLLFFCVFAASVKAQIQVCFTTAEDQNEEVCNHEYCSLNNAPYNFSKGRYRIPYLEFTAVHVTNDHIKHCPRGAIDMSGIGDENTTFHIVAAADGWIRHISDEHTASCSSGCDNNYVWIEHPNGEWTKYTHVKYHSASDLHNDDDWVIAGTLIGEEGSVGISTGPHCHFEVAVPVDTNSLEWDEGGGWIVEAKADNLVPLFCSVPGNIMESGEDYIALFCGSSCDAFIPFVDETYSSGRFVAKVGYDAFSNDHNIIFEGASAGVFQSENSVTLKPGFYAEFLSTFEARTGECAGAGLNKIPQLLDEYAEMENAVSINPNPASQSATLHWFMKEGGRVKISISDMGRRTLIHLPTTEQMNSGSHQQVVDVSNLLPGFYLIILEVNQVKKIQKLVIQR
jgi:hypothetical protein